MTIKAQLQGVTLKSVDFGGIDHDLFQVHAGGDMDQTLGLASDLNLALASLSDRLDFSTNNNGDPVTCAELRALAHISSTANALIQSVRYALRSVIAQEEQA
ncbi:hypothetical protein [Pseudomonas tolaasii]